MRNLFNSVRRPAVRYNKFDLSFPNSLTADYGYLYPCLVKEVNAGEVIRLYTESFVRTMPLRAPAFIRSDASIHYFFVPYRLCYEDWTKFIVRGDDGNTDYDKPYMTVKNYQTDIDLTDKNFKNGSLMDYLNFPTLASNAVLPTSDAKVDMMPFNAYSLIYNEYYRDENLIPEVKLWDQSGYSRNVTDLMSYTTEVLEEWFGVSPGDTPTDQQRAEALFLAFPMFLRVRAWRKDYFTSALPFVQKGVPISLAGGVVTSNGLQDWIGATFYSQDAIPGNTRWFVTANNISLLPQNNPIPYLSRQTSGPVNPSSSFETHYHSPSTATAVNTPLTIRVPVGNLQTSVMTISELRVGLALQQWFELNARTGSNRYFEYLLGHFGVRDRDARLQRPEYLGGFSHSVQISEVEQTSSTDATTPQGNLAGKGLGYSASHSVRYRFPEPGYLMAIFSIRPQAVYYQGMPRNYQRWDAFDYFDPLFDHLSEQPIFNSELHYNWSYIPQTSADPVLGYTPRFSEERTSLAECHGEFRQSLNYWVSPRQINPLTLKLDRDFIEVSGYSQRLYDAFAYTGTAVKPSHHFYAHLNHHISILRPMSKYATPKL